MPVAQRVSQLDVGASPTPAGWEVVRRELHTRVRAPGWVVGTAAVLAAMIGYLVLHGSLLAEVSRTTIGLTGQATGIAEPLRVTAFELGAEITITPYQEPEQARHDIADGTLDVLVSGSTSNLRVLARTSVDPLVRAALTDVSRAEVLNGKLAEAGLDPARVRSDVDATEVHVTTLVAAGQDGQHLAVAVLVMFAVFLGILVYGALAARYLTEAPAPAMTEPQPGRLLLGRIAGVGLAGLTQLTVLGAVGSTAASVTGALTGTAVASAVRALPAALLWYVLGFALHTAALAALSHTSGRAHRTTLAHTLVLAGCFVAAMAVLRQPDSMISAILSVFPLTSPLLSPGRIATGAATPTELLAALTMAVATLALLTRPVIRAHRSQTADRVR